MKHALRAFRYRNYRLFFYGQSLSIIGNWIQQVAMSWLVYRLTGSAWLLGVTGFAGQIAVFLFAPFGGLWADRFDRRKLLIVTQATAMVLAFALSALTYAERVEVWHVIVMATLFGFVLAFDAPIRSSFTPEMVPSRQDLPGAIAINGGMQNGGRMISFFTMSFLGMHPLGSLAAGALASWIGAPHTLAIGGLCAVIGAYVLWRKLPLVREHIRPLYVKLGIINE